MSQTLLTKEFSVRNYGGTGTYSYKLEVILNSQDTAQSKSNITTKVWQKRGSSGYSGNGYIRFSLWGHTSQAPTDVEYVEPVKVSSNLSSTWEELTDLRYTADFTHKADGNLAVRYTVKIVNTGSTNQYAPRTTDLDSGGIAVPRIGGAGVSYTALDLPPDWLVASSDSDSSGTPITFTFTPAAGATSHKIKLMIPGYTLLNDVACTSGTPITITNAQILQIMDMMGTAGSPRIEAIAELSSYSGSTLLGTDKQTFDIIGCGADVKNGTTWCNGIFWVKAGGQWYPGVTWVKASGAWKKGIGVTNE